MLNGGPLFEGFIVLCAPRGGVWLHLWWDNQACHMSRVTRDLYLVSSNCPGFVLNVPGLSFQTKKIVENRSIGSKVMKN